MKNQETRVLYRGSLSMLPDECVVELGDFPYFALQVGVQALDAPPGVLASAMPVLSIRLYSTLDEEYPSGDRSRLWSHVTRDWCGQAALITDASRDPIIQDKDVYIPERAIRLAYSKTEDSPLGEYSLATVIITLYDKSTVHESPQNRALEQIREELGAISGIIAYSKRRG